MAKDTYTWDHEGNERTRFWVAESSPNVGRCGNWNSCVTRCQTDVQSWSLCSKRWRRCQIASKFWMKWNSYIVDHASKIETLKKKVALLSTNTKSTTKAGVLSDFCFFPLGDKKWSGRSCSCSDGAQCEGLVNFSNVLTCWLKLWSWDVQFEGIPQETEVTAAQSEAAAAKELAEKAEVWCGRSKTFCERNTQNNHSIIITRVFFSRDGS